MNGRVLSTSVRAARMEMGSDAVDVSGPVTDAPAPGMVPPTVMVAAPAATQPGGLLDMVRARIETLETELRVLGDKQVELAQLRAMLAAADIAGTQKP